MATDVFETVPTVPAVREYQDQEVPAELVLRLVEAAGLTAGSINLQPWHFLVVQEGQRLVEQGRRCRLDPTSPGQPWRSWSTTRPRADAGFRMPAARSIR